MAFDISSYETVKSRKKRFYEKYPDGRIIVESIRVTADEALFKASVYKDPAEQSVGLPIATGHAQEFKGVGGVANRNCWTENCEESSIGRALDNAGFSGNNQCSREEMVKAKGGEEKSVQVEDL